MPFKMRFLSVVAHKTIGSGDKLGLDRDRCIARLRTRRNSLAWRGWVGLIAGGAFFFYVFFFNI